MSRTRTETDTVTSQRRPLSAAITVALATLALGACSSSDDDSDAMGTAASGAPAGSFAVVMNDGTAPGSVTFYSPDLETRDRVLSTGANEGIAFGPDGTMYQNSDSEGGFIGIRGFSDVAARPDMDGFTDSDVVIGSVPGKGLSYISGADLLASCDVTYATADLTLFAAGTTGAAAAPVVSIDLDAACWDTFYEAAADRLYVALVDGRLAIFDEMSVEIGEAADGVDTDLRADRTVTPVDTNGAVTSVNFHGVSVENGSVLVSDVGSAMSPDDGRLFVFDDADGTLDGNVETSSIGGSASMLGNPVDVVLKGGAAIVAEKSNDAILVFNDVASLAGDMMPDFTLAFTKPESIEEVPATQ